MFICRHEVNQSFAGKAVIANFVFRVFFYHEELSFPRSVFARAGMTQGLATP